MFKHIVTLFRGQLFEAEQEFVDRNALPLLAQQIRDAGEAIQMARRAVAVALAQNQQEEAQFQNLRTKIGDLETRTIAALSHGKEMMAREAAEAIALLEAECETSEKAQQQFSREISKLRSVIASSEARLRGLQRGERLARAAESAQRLNHNAPGNALATIKDAEATLERLRRRQSQMDLTSAILSEMESAGDPAATIVKLAEAGCGTPLGLSAEDVIQRLKARMNNAA